MKKLKVLTVAETTQMQRLCVLLLDLHDTPPATDVLALNRNVDKHRRTMSALRKILGPVCTKNIKKRWPGCSNTD